MSRWTEYRDLLRDRLRKTYPWYVRLDPPDEIKKSDPPVGEPPEVEPPGVPPRPPPQGDDFFITDGNVKIPKGKIDRTSDLALWKPVSEGGGESVVLLPARYVGAAKAVSVAGKSFHCTTRGWDLPNSRAWPNGARDHWRVSPPIRSGTSTVKVTLASGVVLSSSVIALGRKQGFTLGASEPEPTPIPTPDPVSPPSGPVLPQTGRIHYDGASTVTIDPVFGNIRSVLYDGSLGVRPQIYKNAGANSFSFNRGLVLSGSVVIQLHQYGDDYRFEVRFPVGTPWEGDVGVVYVKVPADWPDKMYKQEQFKTRPEWKGTDSSGTFRKWVCS